MEPVRAIAIRGVEPVSPCNECGIHLFGIPKLRNAECKACKARESYDNLIQAGSYTHPFIDRKLKELLGIPIQQINYASERRS